MASVRMTQQLKDEILATIDRKYRTVKDAYNIPQEVRDRMENIGREAMLKDAQACEKFISDAMIAYRTNFPEADEDSCNRQRKRMEDSITTSHWRGFEVRLRGTVYDHDGMGQEKEATLETVFLRASGSSSGYNNETKTSHWLGSTFVVTDPELVALAQPIVQKKLDLTKKSKAAKKQVKNLLDQCSTLKRLLDAAPNLKDVIPEWAMRKHEEKATRPAAKKAEPIEIPSIDDDMAEDLGTVSIQADALDALNGG